MSFILLGVQFPRLRAPNWPLVVTIFSWGFNFVVVKLLYEHMTPASVCLVRYLIMFAALLVLCAVLKQTLRYTMDDFVALMALGALSMGIYMFFFMEGMKRSGAAEAAIILAVSPIFTAILAAAFKQSKLTAAGLIGGLVAFCGVTLVVLYGEHSGSNTVFGNVLILASAAIWAFCAVMTRRLVVRRTPLEVLTLSMPGALIVLVPYGLADSLNTNWAAFSAVTWMSLLFNALMAGAVGFAGFYAGVKKIGAAGAMMYQFFVPPLTAFFAWLILDDPLALMQLVGLVTVFAGVYWSANGVTILTRRSQLSHREQ